MNQRDVIAFFDQRAATWDQLMPDRSRIIGIILDNTHIHAGADVLDIKTPRLIQFNDLPVAYPQAG